MSEHGEVVTDGGETLTSLVHSLFFQLGLLLFQGLPVLFGVALVDVVLHDLDPPLSLLLVVAVTAPVLVDALARPDDRFGETTAAVVLLVVGVMVDGLDVSLHESMLSFLARLFGHFGLFGGEYVLQLDHLRVQLLLHLLCHDQSERDKEWNEPHYEYIICVS